LTALAGCARLTLRALLQRPNNTNDDLDDWAIVRWIVGDVQGCAREFERLLEVIRFRPDQDELWCLGDLINRGPDSLAVLRIWRSVRGRGILGNHEIGALLSFSGTKPKRSKLLSDLFRAPDAGELLGALRNLPILVHLPSGGKGPDAWIVHAGLDPRWTDLSEMSTRINDAPHDDAWLQSNPVDFATNVRCCTRDGRQCDHAGPPGDCPAPFQPWDRFYSGQTLVIHGHWAARGHYRTDRTMGLDSGCVYGGYLTAWCQDEDRIVQIPSRRVP
jgi:bis(5'-nucleosyl)-tetraphosphatase (symmetrical)